MSTTLPRRDGRGYREMRGKELRTSELTQFDGSAWYSQGLSTVIVTVNGPVAARQEDYRKCDVRVHVERAVRMPCAGGTDRLCVEEQREEQRRADCALERFLTTCIEAVVCLERFPRCVLEVYVTVLADDGALFAVATNGLMCALLDACVPCRTTIAAVGIAVCAAGDDIGDGAAVVPITQAVPSQSQAVFLLDPTLAEEVDDGVRSCTTATATFVLPYPSGCGGCGVLASQVQMCPRSSAYGRSLSSKELLAMMTLAEQAAASVFDFFRNCNVPL